MFSKSNYGLVLPKDMFDRDVNNVELLSSEYATDYEYVWVPNMPGFTILWKEVSVGFFFILGTCDF